MSASRALQGLKTWQEISPTCQWGRFHWIKPAGRADANASITRARGTLRATGEGEPDPSAAALIRQQAHEIDDLWDRLSRAYALVRHESPAELIQEEVEQLQAMLDERLAKKTG